MDLKQLCAVERSTVKGHMKWLEIVGHPSVYVAGGVAWCTVCGCGVDWEAVCEIPVPLLSLLHRLR